MAADDQGRIWFVETGVQPNRLVGFLPGRQRFTEPVPIPSGGGTVRNMIYDDTRNALWFGADTNTIGRVRLDVEPEPE
jgi:virginiamycin B lyase